MYDSTGVLHKLKDRTDHLQGCTASFAKSCPEAVSSELRSWKQPVPGPGQYGNVAEKNPNKLHVNAALAAFKSLSKRGEAGPEQGDNPATMPGPGAYHCQKPILPPHGSGHEGHNAIFKEASKFKVCPINKDLPEPSEKAIKALGDFANVVSRECAGQRPTDLPGPGIYNQDRDSMWKGKDCGVHGLSSFLPGPSRIDWGSQEAAMLPGPGNYEIKKCHGLNLTDAKSSFVSASEQHGFADLPKGPGPCYYKPPAPGLEPHRSFNLNSRKRWT